jgi:hypothetical protein
MRERTRRPARVAVVGALVVVLLLLAASPVAAARKSTSTVTGWKVVSYRGQAWTGRVHFYATWDRTYQCSSSGQCWWQFSFSHQSFGVEEGKKCSAFVCGAWTYTAKAEFLNSSGATVKSVTPPIDACISEAWPGTWRVGTRCARNFSVPYTATRIRFSWTVSTAAIAADDMPTFWSATKTVAI